MRRCLFSLRSMSVASPVTARPELRVGGRSNAPESQAENLLFVLCSMRPVSEVSVVFSTSGGRRVVWQTVLVHESTQRTALDDNFGVVLRMTIGSGTRGGDNRKQEFLTVRFLPPPSSNGGRGRVTTFKCFGTTLVGLYVCGANLGGGG